MIFWQHAVEALAWRGAEAQNGATHSETERQPFNVALEHQQPHFRMPAVPGGLWTFCLQFPKPKDPTVLVLVRRANVGHI